MATVTLKNVPSALVRMLKGEAKQNRRSLNQEAREQIAHRCPLSLSATSYFGARAFTVVSRRSCPPG